MNHEIYKNMYWLIKAKIWLLYESSNNFILYIFILF
jgi:hypothetical protein